MLRILPRVVKQTATTSDASTTEACARMPLSITLRVLMSPTPFGPFSLLEPLAAGGMGEVWLAQPFGVPGVSDLCVVKRVKSNLTADDDVLKRFLDEGRLAILLSHPHICRTVDVGRADDSDYLAAEVVEGLDVRRLQQRAGEHGQTIDTDIVLQIVADALDGLAWAHAATHPLTQAPLSVVHRDVSPHNLMLGADGHTRVIDFGLALSSVRQAQTELGVVLGKIAYMAPEQARGDRVGPPCDVFAMGVVLYELLSGERFYGTLTANDIWSRAGLGDHVPAQLASMPEEMRRIVEALTHPDPSVRPTATLARDAVLTVLWQRTTPSLARERACALVRQWASAELARFAAARATAARVAGSLLDMKPSSTMSLALQESKAVEALLAARAQAVPSMPAFAPSVTLPRVDLSGTERLRAGVPGAPTGTRRPPLAVAASVVLLVVAAGIFVATRASTPIAAADATPTATGKSPSVSTTPPSAASPPPAAVPAAMTPAAAAPLPPAPTPTPTPTPATPPPPPPPPPKTTTTTPPSDPFSSERLLARMRALQGCPASCASLYRQFVSGEKATAWPPRVRASIATSLTACEKQCRP